MPDDHDTPSSADLPEPGTRRYHNGWTRSKMQAFLEGLAASASVTGAAQAVGMSRDSAYKLRARLSGTPFDLLWEAALEHALRQVAHAAVDRAINGVAQPVFYRDEQIGERRVFNESLTRFILDNPSRFGRNHEARAYGLEHWDGMLRRMVEGSLEWETDEDSEEETHAELADHRKRDGGG